MAAAAAAVSHDAAKVASSVAKAAANWDPIGAMVAKQESRNLNLIGNFLENKVAKLDPIGTAVHTPIGNVLEQAGEEIRDWGEWLPETINKTGMAIDNGMRDIGVDPNTVKTAIVGFFAPYAVPLVQAAMVKAQGGDWEDVALAAATAYVAQGVGAYVGDYVSSVVTSGVGITSSQVAAEAAKSGITLTTKQAADIAARNATALGFGTTFTATTLANMASAGVSNATAQLIRTGSVDLSKALQATATAGIASGVSALTKQIPGFKELPAATQRTINQQITSSLQGRDVDTDAMAMSIAGDMAMSAMRNYWNDKSTGFEKAYNSAAEQYNGLMAKAREWVTPAEEAKAEAEKLQADATTTVDQINGIINGEAANARKNALDTQARIDALITDTNKLIDAANASKSSANVPTIDANKKLIEDLYDQRSDWLNVYDAAVGKVDALKGTLDSIVTQRDSYVNLYNDNVGSFYKAIEEVKEPLSVVLAQRDELYLAMAKSVDPEFDPTAYKALNPEAAKAMEAPGDYGTPKSAAEIFVTQQAQNPDAVQKTSWREGFLSASNAQEFDTVADSYKKATGFDLTPKMADTDFATYAAYQTGLATSTQDLLAKATEAENAGNAEGYAQYMSQALQRAADENLGWVKRDDSGNYIWGDKVYDNTGAWVGDYTPPETGTPDITKEDYRQSAQALYGYLDPSQVAEVQDTAKVEGVKKALEAQGYKATTQAEAEQLAKTGKTYGEVSQQVADYAKEHTVTLDDAMDYLKQFNYQNFAKSLLPYIGQGAQYTQAKMRQDALQQAMQSAMQQSRQFTPASYQAPTGAAGTAGASGATGLAALAALMGGTRTGGVAPEAPQMQLRSTGVTPYGDSAAAATGQVGVGKLLQQEMQFGAQPEASAEAPREFGDIEPNTEEQDDMSYFREGGVIPNVNFGYADQVQAMASGGIASLPRGATGSNLGSYSDGGQLLRGPGTGLSDNIPATIDRDQPARLASGEFVVPADVVSALGGGSTEAGAKILYEMLARVRKDAHGSERQIRKVNPNKVLPK